MRLALPAAAPAPVPVFVPAAVTVAGPPVGAGGVAPGPVASTENTDGPDAAAPRPAGLPTVPGTGVATDTCVVAPRGRIGDVLSGRPQGPTTRTGDGRERDGGRFGGLGGLGRIGGGRRPF